VSFFTGVQWLRLSRGCQFHAKSFPPGAIWIRSDCQAMRIPEWPGLKLVLVARLAICLILPVKQPTSPPK
jgi:hypothetical protein